MASRLLAGQRGAASSPLNRVPLLVGLDSGTRASNPDYIAQSARIGANSKAQPISSPSDLPMPCRDAAAAMERRIGNVAKISSRTVGCFGPGMSIKRRFQECARSVARSRPWLMSSSGGRNLRPRLSNALKPFSMAIVTCSIRSVVMPNHVHALLVRCMNGHSLSEILHSWKSFPRQKKSSARERRYTEAVWQDENYDRMVRGRAGV